MQIGTRFALSLMEKYFFLILRPVGDNYLVVGECYVHGLVYRETRSLLDSGEVEVQWFDLQ